MKNNYERGTFLKSPHVVRVLPGDWPGHSGKLRGVTSTYVTVSVWITDLRTSPLTGADWPEYLTNKHKQQVLCS